MRRITPPGEAAALYHRVSTFDQDAAAARQDLRAAAKARGLRVELEVEETGSGARNDRPGLHQVLEAARRGRIRVVLVWKLDRFGRSTLDLLSNVQALVDAGVRFVAVTQGIDVKSGGDSLSTMHLQVLAAVAEYERNNIRDNTRQALRRLRARGVQLGRPRLTYPTGEQVQALRAQRLSWAEIAAALSCSTGKARRALAEMGTDSPRRGNA